MLLYTIHIQVVFLYMLCIIYLNSIIGVVLSQTFRFENEENEFSKLLLEDST